tara:strand:- start:916 stop:1152 length:237 start_codon:yes stop_codon:yes gene_type:complete
VKYFTTKITAFLFLFLFELSYACSTCYGDPNSNAGKGMDMAIITLLGVITPLLIAIAAGIISIGLKSKKINRRTLNND